MSSSDENNPKCTLGRSGESNMSRRDFLGLAAFWSCVGAWFLTLIGLGKFPMPALLPDVSSIFKLGKPDDIPMGTDRIIEDVKIRVVRDDEGIYAVSMICTHLGCIVSKTEKGYSCPCHGSKFNQKGGIISGPAPKGLNWLEVSQLPSGKLVVNTNKFVQAGKKFVV